MLQTVSLTKENSGGNVQQLPGSSDVLKPSCICSFLQLQDKPIIIPKPSQTLQMESLLPNWQELAPKCLQLQAKMKQGPSSRPEAIWQRPVPIQTANLCDRSETVVAPRLSVEDDHWPMLPLKPCPKIVTKMNITKYLSVNNPCLFPGNIECLVAWSQPGQRAFVVCSSQSRLLKLSLICKRVNNLKQVTHKCVLKCTGDL